MPDRPSPNETNESQAGEEEIADEVWDETTGDHTSTGTTGRTLDDLDSKLPDGTLPDQLDVASPGEVDAEVEQVLARDPGSFTESLTDGSIVDVVTQDLDPRLPGSGTLSTLTTSDVSTPSEVNTEVESVIKTDYSGDADIAASSLYNVIVQDLEPRLPSSNTISTLSLSDILSDATAFSGSDIDASISSRASTTDLDPLFSRQTPDEGQTTTSGTTTVTVADLGTTDGTTTTKIEGLWLFTTLNDQTSVDLTLNVEINGTMRQVGSTVTVSSTGGVVTELADFGVEGPLAAPHVTVDVTGADGSPATEATVDRTVSHTQAS